jgi:hypothetical protein
MLFAKLTSSLSVLALSMVFSTSVSAEQKAPTAPEASPDIYKILAENEQWRVIQATWQPGQEDNLHSHPPDRVSLFTTDCMLRLTKPDGTFRDATPKAGKAKVRTGEPVKAHTAKNMGDKACVMTIVEPKK